MKKILLVMALALSLYYVIGKDGQGTVSGFDTPSGQYIHVYGRDTCGYTTRMRQRLEESGVEFEYRIIDDSQVANELHMRMRSADVDTRRYNLPVVEVNGYILIRPELDDVLQRYQ